MTANRRRPIVGSAVPDPVGLVRAARRRADTSQRQMARRSGLSRSTIARIEAGTLVPSLATVSVVLEAAGIRLVAVDRGGRPIPLMADPPDQDLRDGAERRYPSHLDTVVDPAPGEWWGGRYGLARPPETFHRCRGLRDAKRRRSRWEVRVAENRAVPPPPTGEQWQRRHDESWHRAQGCVPDLARADRDPGREDRFGAREHRVPP